MLKEVVNLSWNEFKNSTSNAFKSLQENHNFADVTLACEDGKQLQAHKVVISSCSTFFRDILLQNPHQHPLLYLKGVTMEDLTQMLKFIYSGEVQIDNENLPRFLDTANDFKIEGLKQDKVPTSQNEAGHKEAKFEPVEEYKPKEIELEHDETLVSMDRKDTEESPKYECKYCPNTFKYKTNANRHMEKVHAHIVQKPTVVDNSKKVENSNFVCEVCLQHCQSISDLKAHIEINHEAITFMCAHCAYISSLKDELINHMEKKHPEKELPVSFMTSINEDTEFQKSFETFQPKMLAKPVKDKEAEQKKQFDGLEKDTIEHIELEEKLNSITELRDGLWTCLNCGKEDKMRFHLRRHAETHITDFLHACKQCTKTFKTRAALKQHMNSYHKIDVTETGHPCNACEMSSVSIEGLRIHKRTHHTAGLLSIQVQKNTTPEEIQNEVNQTF